MSRTSERDHMLHERLKAAYDRDVVTFYTNFEKLHAPASPIFDPWLAGGPLLGLLSVAITLLFLGGLVVGTIAMIIAVVCYVIGVRPWMETQFRNRAIEMALRDVKSFQALWKYGGIGIAMTDRPETIIAAPEGHWRTFLGRHLPDIEATVLDEEMQNFVPEGIPGRPAGDGDSVITSEVDDDEPRRYPSLTVLPPEEATPPGTGESSPEAPSPAPEDFFDRPLPEENPPHQREK